MGEVARRSLSFLLAYAVGLCTLVVAGRWAIRRAESISPRSVRAFRLSFATCLLSLYVPAAIAAILAFAGPHLCIAGAPGQHESPICFWVAIAMLIYLLLGLGLVVASYWFWLPWRGPWKMQVIRVVQIAFWIIAIGALGLVCDA